MTIDRRSFSSGSCGAAVWRLALRSSLVVVSAVATGACTSSPSWVAPFVSVPVEIQEASPELQEMLERIGSDFIVVAPYGQEPQFVASDGTMIPLPFVATGRVRFDGSFVYGIARSGTVFQSAAYLPDGQQVCESDGGEIVSVSELDNGEFEMTVLPLPTSGEAELIFVWGPAYIANCATGEARSGGDQEPYEWRSPRESVTIGNQIVTRTSSLDQRSEGSVPVNKLVISDASSNEILDEFEFEGVVYYP